MRIFREWNRVPGALGWVAIGAVGALTALFMIVTKFHFTFEDSGVSACRQLAGASGDYRTLSREFARSDHQTLREAGARWLLASLQQRAPEVSSSVAVDRGEELSIAWTGLREACADFDVKINVRSS